MPGKIVENGADRSTGAKDLARDVTDAGSRGEQEESAFLAEATRAMDG